MRLEWTKRARSNLREVRTFIASDSSSRASRVIDNILDATEQLERFPEMGGVVEQWGRDDIRELLVGKYRVIYLVTAQEVRILTVIHASRLLPEEPEI